MEITEFLSFFRNVKKEGGSQYQADCPACGDNKRHLYIAAAPGGKLLLDCKKGCTFSEIVTAAGLKEADCFGENPVKKEPWKLLREHYYTDENGGILAKKQIYDTGGGKKQAVWYRLENGKYIKGLDGKKMPLYHLEKLVNSVTAIVFVEGEKDAETVERLGFTATTSPNGAGSKWRKDFTPYFKDKNVVVLSDNDEVGDAFGDMVAHEIIGHAKAVKRVRSADIYPNVKHKGDISDIAAELGDAKAKELLRAAVLNSASLSPEAVTAPAPRVTEADIVVATPVNEPIAEKLAKLKPHLKYTFNDKGNGALFAEIFRDKCRYNITAKEWYVFKDGYWQQDTGGMIVSGFAKDLHTELVRYSSFITDPAVLRGFNANLEKLGKLNYRETMIKDARDVYFIRSEDFDKNDWLFNCRNGTYDLKNGYFRAHNPNDLMSKMSNVTYSAEADSPLFRKFIRDIMCSDMDKAKYLQSALGYALTGDTSQECFFILFGATTRNGKGTLMETISYMMGDGYAMSSQPEVFARKQNKDSRQASGDIARLKGVRFLNASEPPKSMAFDAALLKTLTGRDTITARHLHEREFQFIPNFKLFINTNYLPYVNDETLFSSERVNVITFEKHFAPEEQDRELKQKLRSEENIAGIFNWCLEGLRNYLSEGLKRPMSVSAANEEYRKSGDRLTMFLNECLEPAQGTGCQVKDVYPIYKEWCASNGFTPENVMNWTAGLRQKNIYRQREQINGLWRKGVIYGYIISEEYAQCGYENAIFDEPPI